MKPRGRLFPAALLLAVFAAGSAAQVTYPATPAGRRLEAWIVNFNQGKEEATQQFAAENYAAALLQRVPAERWAAMDTDLHARWGKLKLFRAESARPLEASITAQDAEGTKWIRVTIRVEGDPPNKIAEVNFDRIPRPFGAAAAPRLTDTELFAALEKLLQQRADADKFSGAVLIARNGKPVFVKAYGRADVNAKISNRPDTKFALGSMNKMITSVAVAQLVQAGKLKYSDTIARVLADYPNKEVAAKVRVHDLLTHTSGLGDVFGPEFDEKKDDLRAVRDWFPLFVDKPLRFEPGKSWSYSNAGYVVLGAIIEKLSGQDYYSYVREHIYQPAGMSDSDSYSKRDTVENMAEGYTGLGMPRGQWKNNVDTRPLRGFPAGGGYSTVYDLLKFSEALRGHKLLNAEYTDLVISGKVDPQPGSPRRYAYGFEDNRTEGIRTVGHGGGAPGMNSQLDIYWDAGVTVAVLANLDPPAAGDIADYIRDRIQPARAGRTAEKEEPKAGQKTTSRGPVKR